MSDVRSGSGTASEDTCDRGFGDIVGRHFSVNQRVWTDAAPLEVPIVLANIRLQILGRSFIIPVRRQEVSQQEKKSALMPGSLLVHVGIRYTNRVH